MFERLGRLLSLAGIILLAAASARCVSVSPGVAVELLFAAPPGGDEGGTTEVTQAAGFVIAATLVPCDDRTAASWDFFGPAVARAHTDATGARTWLGAQRVDALSAVATPLGLLSPPAVPYCAIELTFAADETSEADPREDPMVGRSLGVAGRYLRRDGSRALFAVRTSQERVETVTFAEPLILDEADDIAQVTVSFDARGWAAGMDFDAASAAQRQAALLNDLHSYLAATTRVRKQ